MDTRRSKRSKERIVANEKVKHTTESEQESSKVMATRKRKSAKEYDEPFTKRVTRSSKLKTHQPNHKKRGSVINKRQKTKTNAKVKLKGTTKHTQTTRRNTPSMGKSQSVSVPKKKRVNSDISEIVPPQLEIIQTINTQFKGLVSHAVCVDENTMWVGRQAYDKLMKVHYSVNELSVIKEFSYPEHSFSDFCLDTFANGMFYCDRKSSRVFSIMEDFQIRIFKCFEPLKPVSITISPDNYIFIGLVDHHNYNESPNRAIIKLSRDGSECLRIMGLEKKQLRFCFPHRVVINPVNNHIIVSAGLGMHNDYQGQVVNFNSEGKLIFTYKDQRPKAKFRVIGLACSPTGNIICANEFNGDIHILDKAGTLLNLVSQSSLGIPGKPWGLSMNKQGHLVIGAMLEPFGVIYIAKYTEHKSPRRYPENVLNK